MLSILVGLYHLCICMEVIPSPVNVKETDVLIGQTVNAYFTRQKTATSKPPIRYAIIAATYGVYIWSLVCVLLYFLQTMGIVASCLIPILVGINPYD